MTFDELRDRRRRHGFARKDSDALLITRLAAIDGVDRKRNIDGDGVMDTAGTSGTRNCAPAGAAGNSEELLGCLEKRCRAGYLHSAFVAEKEVAEEHAQWRNPALEARWGATHSSAAGGEDAAISAWAAEECRRVLGQKCMKEELARAAQEQELAAWRKFKVSPPAKGRAPFMPIADTRWALTWEMVDGQKGAKARLVAKGYQGPDLTECVVENSGCVNLVSFRIQVISLGALK